MTIKYTAALLLCLLAQLLPAADPDPDAALAAARSGGDYLLRTIQPDGEFTYRYDPYENSATDTYNWLRHAGTVAALCQLAAATDDPRYLGAADTAAACLARQIKPITLGDQRLHALISDPARTRINRATGPVVKAGGNALAIFALDSVDRAHDGQSPYGPVIQNLGAYLLAARDATGTPRSKYVVSLGRFDSWKSSYYPGQCLLAFAILQERAPDARWRAAMHRLAATKLQDIEAQLASPMLRDGQAAPSQGFDHWTMIGMARALPLLDPERLSSTERVVTREIIVQALVAYGAQEVRQQITDGDPAVLGSFALNPGGTVSAAIRIEGLLAIRAAATTAAADHPSDRLTRLAAVTHSWDPAIARSRGLLSRSQYTTTPAGDLDITGGLRAAVPITPRTAPIQIDYVQHAISAWLTPY